MDINTPNESHKKYFFKYLKIFVIILTIFVGIEAVSALKEYSYIGLGTPAVNIITVNGKGEVMAKPDIADFTFTVSEEGKTAKQAQDKATVKSNAALKAIKDAGVEDKDVKTLSYDLSPKYEWEQTACPMNNSASGIIYPCPPGKQVTNGYVVTQTIEVKVRKIDSAGPLLTKITSAGVSNISGINFVVDDRDALLEQAKGMAITDAKTKAETLAKQLGVKLARIVSFSDQSGPIYYANAYGTDVMSAGIEKTPTPQLPAGENKITSNVSITYEIR